MSRQLRKSASATAGIDKTVGPISDDGVRVLRRRSIKIRSERDSSAPPRKKSLINVEFDQNQNSVYSIPNEQNSSHVSLNGCNEQGLNLSVTEISILRRIETMYQKEFANITDRFNIKTPIKCFINQSHCAQNHLNTVGYLNGTHLLPTL